MSVKQDTVGAIVMFTVAMSVACWVGINIPDPMVKVIQADIETPARFEKAGTVVVEYRPVNDLTGTIYKDRETGISYLYIWDGAGNGGPAITRLWEKGE